VKDSKLQDSAPAAPRCELPIWREDGQVLHVNELFWSLEGEGVRVGEPTFFIRLAGCNLRCRFCDTDFDAFEEMTVEEIVAEVQRRDITWVCLTGGEPLLQNILPLCQTLHEKGYRLHIETNGTIDPDPRLYDYIEHWTVSPKARTIAAGLTYITELKYVVGKSFREGRVEEDRADYIYLQPESSKPENIQRVLQLLRRHPNWRLSLRVHTMIGLP
jgi:7-carboxy-7-deazaguanine synthase